MIAQITEETKVIIANPNQQCVDMIMPIIATFYEEPARLLTKKEMIEVQKPFYAKFVNRKKRRAK